MVRPSTIYIAADKALSTELSDFLESDGFAVRRFEHGFDLLALMDNWPDLFLIDIRLPDINGLEVCSWLKSQESSSHIPVILMSEDSYLKLLAPSAHADNFVEPGMGGDKILDKIYECLGSIRADGRAF